MEQIKTQGRLLCGGVGCVNTAWGSSDQPGTMQDDIFLSAISIVRTITYEQKKIQKIKNSQTNASAQCVALLPQASKFVGLNPASGPWWLDDGWT